MMDKKKPLDDDVLPDTSRGFDEAEKLPARVLRYSKAKTRSVENYLHVRSLSNTSKSQIKQKQFSDLASKLSDCGNYLVFNHYYTKGLVRLSKASFCRIHLLCPLCAIRRASKTLESYLLKYRLIKEEYPDLNLSMITYTVKNGNDLNERFEHINNSIRKLLARRRDYLKKGRGYNEFVKAEGAVGTYEVTNIGNGWHPHVHMMVLHYGTFDYKKLKEEWYSITKDSHVVNVMAAKHPEEPEKDFVEVFKYAVKFSGLSVSDNVEAWEVLRGRRLLFSFGLFRGVKVSADLKDDLLEDLPYIELFYKYLNGGYSLFKTNKVE